MLVDCCLFFHYDHLLSVWGASYVGRDRIFTYGESHHVSWAATCLGHWHKESLLSWLHMGDKDRGVEGLLVIARAVSEALRQRLLAGALVSGSFPKRPALGLLS